MRIRNLLFKSYFSIAVGLSAISAALILIVRSNLPPLVPLFYGRPVGSGQLIPKLGLFALPIITLGICLINIFLSNNTKDVFLKKVLAVSSLLISILGIITLTKIIMLVGFW